jgi:hypothetical protein
LTKSGVAVEKLVRPKFAKVKLRLGDFWLAMASHYLHSILRLSRYCQRSVCACLPPKVLDGTDALLYDLLSAYRFNRLRVDAEGHLSAPVKPSEHLLLFQVPETKSAI